MTVSASVTAIFAQLGNAHLDRRIVTNAQSVQLMRIVLENFPAAAALMMQPPMENHINDALLVAVENVQADMIAAITQPAPVVIH